LSHYLHDGQARKTFFSTLAKYSPNLGINSVSFVYICGMNHAYLILAHKNPVQLMRMISALQADNNRFYVHVDNKSSGMARYLQSMIDCPDQLRVCDRQININWGGFSMIEATVCLMNMLRDSDFRADYAHLLSGQDFPLCSPQAIDRFFESNAGKNFMEYHAFPYENWNNGGWDRIIYKWDADGGKTDKEQLEPRAFPENIQPYGGSQWWSLTGECVEWLAGVSRPDEPLYDFYRHTFIPDEMYFQTVILHSKFAETAVNDNRRYYDWTAGPEYPRVLTHEDRDKLFDSGKLFARKFDICRDAMILNMISSHINNM
jgi:hypothetical protein